MVTNSFRKKNIQPMRGLQMPLFFFAGGGVGFRVNPNPKPKCFFFWGKKLDDGSMKVAPSK